MKAGKTNYKRKQNKNQPIKKKTKQKNQTQTQPIKTVKQTIKQKPKNPHRREINIYLNSPMILWDKSSV